MKLMVFLPMIIFMVIFGLLVGGFIFLIVKIAVKTKNSYWKGEVVDKLANNVEDDDRNSTYYTLVVKTDSGVTRKIAVTSDMYRLCKVGDTLEKPKGALNPVRL
jgi:hypothetical protein